MSTVGQVVGGIGGAVIGFFASGGNPMGGLYGAQIGVFTESVLDPEEAENEAIQTKNNEP
ncbi:hypothetical protein [Propionivibrio sp.]|uniref:hypothetical protein n=1 Tax=Propionivibrio sp. TaxID=2212460 RepID=UPI00272EAC06|nr:hypothetical protein [Propionivibrio sp.]